MVKLNAVIVETGATPQVALREQRALNKFAWEATGKYWGQEMLPRHFSAMAQPLYGYRDRTAKYQARKQKQFGHTRPLVFSGETELMSKFFRVRPTKYGAQITVQAPAVNLCQRGEELRAVAEPEAKDLGEKLKSEGFVFLGKFRNERRVTKAG